MHSWIRRFVRRYINVSQNVRQNGTFFWNVNWTPPVVIAFGGFLGILIIAKSPTTLWPWFYYPSRDWGIHDGPPGWTPLKRRWCRHNRAPGLNMSSLLLVFPGKRLSPSSIWAPPSRQQVKPRTKSAEGLAWREAPSRGWNPRCGPGGRYRSRRKAASMRL